MKGKLKSTNNSLSNNRLSRQLSAWGNNSDSALFPPSTLKPLYHPAPQSPNPPPLPSPTNVPAIASLSVTAVLDCSYSVSCSNLESKRSAPTAGDFQKQQASSNVNLLSWSVWWFMNYPQLSDLNLVKTNNGSTDSNLGRFCTGKRESGSHETDFGSKKV